MQLSSPLATDPSKPDKSSQKGKDLWGFLASSKFAFNKPAATADKAGDAFADVVKQAAIASKQQGRQDDAVTEADDGAVPAAAGCAATQPAEACAAEVVMPAIPLSDASHHGQPLSSVDADVHDGDKAGKASGTTADDTVQPPATTNTSSSTIKQDGRSFTHSAGTESKSTSTAGAGRCNNCKSHRASLCHRHHGKCQKKGSKSKWSSTSSPFDRLNQTKSKLHAAAELAKKHAKLLSEQHKDLFSSVSSSAHDFVDQLQSQGKELQRDLKHIAQRMRCKGRKDPNCQLKGAKQQVKQISRLANKQAKLLAKLGRQGLESATTVGQGVFEQLRQQGLELSRDLLHVGMGVSTQLEQCQGQFGSDCAAPSPSWAGTPDNHKHQRQQEQQEQKSQAGEQTSHAGAGVDQAIRTQRSSKTTKETARAVIAAPGRSISSISGQADHQAGQQTPASAQSTDDATRAVVWNADRDTARAYRELLSDMLAWQRAVTTPGRKQSPDSSTAGHNSESKQQQISDQLDLVLLLPELTHNISMLCDHQPQTGPAVDAILPGKQITKQLDRFCSKWSSVQTDLEHMLQLQSGMNDNMVGWEQQLHLAVASGDASAIVGALQEVRVAVQQLEKVLHPCIHHVDMAALHAQMLSKAVTAVDPVADCSQQAAVEHVKGVVDMVEEGMSTLYGMLAVLSECTEAIRLSVEGVDVVVDDAVTADIVHSVSVSSPASRYM
eukprot:jgi/Chrzof1/8447/Cz03g10290.t1